MEVIRLTANVASDGHLRIDISTNLAQREVQVVIVIQQQAVEGCERRGAYDFSDLVGRLHWEGDPMATQRSLRDG
jgi:hypothetical protein